MKAARKLQRLQQPRVFLDFVRQFLTPAVWKQARQAVPRRRALPRWDLQPLVLVMMAMTWAAGDSQFEKFQTARGFYAACHIARKRPGKTLEGFQKALSRVPMRQFRALAAGVRLQIRARFAGRLLVDGFEPFGCDGTRLEAPRATELEKRLAETGKTDSAPTVWVTALVHLGVGVLWAWQIGPGNAAEQVHLRQVLVTLSKRALIVCDAAYMGFDLVRQITQSGRSFLFRMSSRVSLYTLENVALEDWTDGPVLYWPKYAQERELAPLLCRLIRVPKKAPRKHDVWLLTDIVDCQRLPAATAAKFYRWRWRNEGIFRIYKRMINKVKLTSRSVRLVHREAELSLLATQLLLAHADLALRTEKEAQSGEAVISPRKVLLEIRREMQPAGKRRQACYGQRLRKCRAETRKQTSAKSTREWPRKKPHKEPRPPILLTLSEEQKILLCKHMSVAA